MPVKSKKDIPKGIRENLTKKGEDAFKKAFNAALKQYDGDESKAFAVAQSAAKKTPGGYTKNARKEHGGKPPKNGKK